MNGDFKDQFLSQAPKCRVLVIGDVMLDRYVNGEVTRVSPEDPTCLVLSHEPPVERKLGGAANVAGNIAALGATADLIGLGGDRKFRDQFRATVKTATLGFVGDLRYNLTDSTPRRFTVKTRYCAHGKQLLRVDDEEIRVPSAEETEELQHIYQHQVEQQVESMPDIAILSDYGKGVLLSSGLWSSSSTARKQTGFLGWLVARLAKDKIPYVVDPKRDDVGEYGPALAICPNLTEWHNICHAGHKALATHVVVTEGEAGCTLMPWKDGKRLHDEASRRFPVELAEMGDPTGAGDSFVATLALALACKLSIDDACKVANAAARHVVMHRGTVAVSLEDLGKDL
jgi:D-beta-D-heptose 7-phosphate kinase/D-beta-D-heptose 1-phosphate adenosyltransferase